ESSAQDGEKGKDASLEMRKKDTAPSNRILSRTRLNIFSQPGNNGQTENHSASHMSECNSCCICLCAKETEQNSWGEHKSYSKEELDHSIGNKESPHFHSVVSSPKRCLCNWVIGQVTSVS